jgi:hypothetical protein
MKDVINDEENIIELTLIADTSLIEIIESALYFKIMNKSKFEIRNLHYAAAYGAPIIMTFEKENMQNN